MEKHNCGSCKNRGCLNTGKYSSVVTDCPNFIGDEKKWSKAFMQRPYRTETEEFVVVPKLKKVIFNPPATIVLWDDNTKTVVKCGENDIFDPEKGLAMAISKRALGNEGNYYNTFAKWMPEPEEEGRSTFLMTVREYIEKNYPDSVGFNFIYGGISGCPGMYVRHMKKACGFPTIKGCNECYDQIIPLNSIDVKTGEPIYKDDAE